MTLPAIFVTISKVYPFSPKSPLTEYNSNAGLISVYSSLMYYHTPTLYTYVAGHSQSHFSLLAGFCHPGHLTTWAGGTQAQDALLIAHWSLIICSVAQTIKKIYFKTISKFKVVIDPKYSYTYCLLSNIRHEDFRPSVCNAQTTPPVF